MTDRWRNRVFKNFHTVVLRIFHRVTSGDFLRTNAYAFVHNGVSHVKCHSFQWHTLAHHRAGLPARNSEGALTMQTPFIAHFNGWKGGEVILLVVDHEGVPGLISQFERLAAEAPPESGPAQFVLGDGNPVESDGRCLLRVELNQHLNGSHVTRISQGVWHWSVSRVAADKFRALLSGLSVPEPGHQYLDNDSGPTVEVSRGEYGVDFVRRWAAS
jgi:hypothetical protein